MKYKSNTLSTTIRLVIIITIIMCMLICGAFYLINNRQKQALYNNYNLSINDTIAVYEIQKNVNEYIIVAIIILVISSMLYILINYISYKNEKKELQEILKNVEKIYKNDYSFIVEETSKGIFQSELYKLFIKLQEYAKEIETDRNKLNSYLSDISHQIRTPLFSVTVLVDNLIENNHLSKEEEKEYLNKISLQLDKISWLVDNLLKMAQLDTKAINMNKNKIYVKEIVKDVLKNLEVMIDLKASKIKIKGNDEVSFIGDFKWSLEALTNILKNSLEHSENGSNIYINYEENPLYTEIKIKDTGCGMDKEDLKHIFDRFYKGKNSNKDSFGIGLSLAKEIIDLQDGEINVKSKLNIGTEFSIRFIKKS